MTRLAHAWLGTALLVGCGTSHVADPPVDAGADATVDAGRDAAPGPDAGAIDPACVPGETRELPCGSRCGSVVDRCAADGRWEEGACEGERECVPSTTETRSTGAACAAETRACTSECTWTEWTSSNEGCAPGETRWARSNCGPTDWERPQICSASCVWENTDDACRDRCRGVPREDGSRAERCVPAGPFVRGGGEPGTPAHPPAEVTLAAFYVDAYPVTNNRYAECMLAGECAAPRDATGATALIDPLRPEHPVQGVTYEQARTFCAWDGERRLPTEAEWEKALRGSAPRASPYPWGDDYDCSIVRDATCGYVPVGPPQLVPDAWTDPALPVSPFGTVLQYGGALEWVADWYSATYYADPSSRSDPEGPAAPTSRRSLRGVMRASATHEPLHRRSSEEPARTSTEIGFRCARDAP